jgi:hypothetical protein
MNRAELAERFNQIVEAESLAVRIQLAQALRVEVARIIWPSEYLPADELRAVGKRFQNATIESLTRGTNGGVE